MDNLSKSGVSGCMSVGVWRGTDLSCTFARGAFQGGIRKESE